MKFVAIGTAREQLAELCEAAQEEPVCLTRHGKPVVVISGVEGKDAEQVMLERSPEFWKMIDEVRKSKRPRHTEAEVRKRFGVPARKKAG
jgi:prevent-host-death family protein